MAKDKLVYHYYIYAVATALLVLPATAWAQVQSLRGDITVTPLELQQRGDSLYVALDFKMSDLSVNSNRSVDLTPVLSSNGSSLLLPEVSIKGRQAYKAYLRQMALMNDREKAAYNQNAPYRVIKYNKANRETLHYQYAVPYKEWMQNAHLDLQKDLCGCGNSATIVEVRLIDAVSTEKKPVIAPYQIQPRLAYIQPVAEAVKKRAMQNESYLDFAVAKTDIRPEYGNNPVELAKIRRMIEELKNDKDVTVRGLSITGYASPEGSSDLNQHLSEGRAKALQNYLEGRYDIPRDLYTVRFGGEDWDGLVRMLESSDMDYKQEVLDIINANLSENSRESKLISLREGAPYRQMLKEMYPALRRVICKVDYEVKSFDVTEAKEMIKVKPQNLSLNEMYAVANQYENGSPEFNEVFETAVRMFPEDETANLNAAASALSRKDLVSAERYLKKIRSKVRIPEYDNAMGVLLMFNGDYEGAESHLKAARQAGLKEADANLDELARKRENIGAVEKSETK